MSQLGYSVYEDETDGYQTSNKITTIETKDKMSSYLTVTDGILARHSCNAREHGCGTNHCIEAGRYALTLGRTRGEDPG